MRPFFRYMGSKYQLAPLYGQPRRDLVIEPFAGSAGYSTFWEPKKAILTDTNPIIARVWKFLIYEATPEMLLDTLTGNEVSQDEVDGPQGLKELVGFWFTRGSPHPQNAISPKNLIKKQRENNSIWCPATVTRIAKQVPLIKDWEFLDGGYERLGNADGHWHIDPPYQKEGHNYTGGLPDFAKLAKWCLDRKGTGEVCESSGADWLPFVPLKTKKSQKNEEYTEVFYRLDKEGLLDLQFK